MEVPKVGLITFGDGNLAYRRAAKRVVRQSRFFQVFQTCQALTKKELRNEFEDECKLIHWEQPFLGYYAWKPLVLKWALKNFSADINLIYYVDSGSWVNVTPESKVKLIKNLNVALASGGLVFSSGYLEKKYSKAEIINELNPSIEQQNSIQYAGGQWILKRQLAEQISDLWWHYASKINLIDNNFDPNIQCDEFIANRNDQSIFSLILKKHQVAMSTCQIDIHPYLHKIGETELSIPYWAARHRSGSLSMSMNPVFRALRAIEQLLP